MNENQLDNATIENLLVETVRKEKPQTTKQLVKIMQDSYGLPEKKVLKAVIKLDEENLLQLVQMNTRRQNFLFSPKLTWYWATVIVAAVAVIVVFAIPPEVYPIGYVRIGLGAIYVLFLPGYVLTRLVFHAKFSSSKREIDELDYLALSIGFSIAIVAAIGLLLNYTPWGLSLTTITIALLVFTLILSTAVLFNQPRKFDEWASENVKEKLN